MFFLIQYGIILKLCLLYTDSGNPYINIRNAVPGGQIHNTGDGKIKDSLKLSDSVRSQRAIGTIHRHFRNCSIYVTDSIQLVLNGSDIIAAGSYP